MTKERFQSIEERTKKLKELLAGRGQEAQAYLERFDLAWVYHDNALEGVVYNPQELTIALHPGGPPPEASLLPLVWEIRNHKAAIDFIREEAQSSRKGSPLTLTFVRRIHDLLTGSTPEAQNARAQAERRERTEKELAKEKEKQGFRRDMPLHRSYVHEIAQPAKIQPQLEKLIDWTSSAEFRELHPIPQALKVQHQFIQIFPFTEHSGKVGRMLTNFLLLRAGFFPVVVVDKDRQKYYEGFRASISTFSNLLLDAMENSLEHGLKYFRDLNRTYR